MRRSKAPVASETAASEDMSSKNQDKSSGSDCTDDYVSRLPLPMAEVPMKEAAKAMWEDEKKE